jgi:hypothetical protein
MYLMVYVSSAVNLFSDQELEELLKTSRTKNEAVEVTGMLLYKDGNFMQLLEGPKDAVEKVFEKIEKDQRHRGIIRLLHETSADRNFGDWSMGFQKLDHDSAQDLPGYSDFLDVPLTSDDFVQHPSKAFSLLLNFKKVVR